MHIGDEEPKAWSVFTGWDSDNSKNLGAEQGIDFYIVRNRGWIKQFSKFQHFQECILQIFSSVVSFALAISSAIWKSATLILQASLRSATYCYLEDQRGKTVTLIHRRSLCYI